jgi:hypothetical protein
MDVGLRTPLLDFFRRGEVAREVRLVAAQGAVAPRPLEQLGILALLTEDADEEVRSTAEHTLSRIPADLIAAFVARADVPTELRAFFAGRGIEPSGSPADEDVALIDTDDTDYGPETADDEKGSISQQVAGMSVPQKVKAAMKGTREMRAILIRDPNRMVAAAVLSSPKLTEQEVETISRMPNVAEDVLRTVAQTRGWIKNYNVVLGLTKNPKTPLAISLNLLNRLNDRDFRALSIDRNVPEPLRIAARKKVVLSGR